MKKILIAILLSSLYSLLFCQQPELIIDFNSGADDSFSEWNYNGINYKNNVFLPIVSKEYGEELAIVTDGQLKLFKDINVGINDSEPSDFIIFNDALYFVANDGINGFALWKTDGTEEGTKMFFDPGEDIYSKPTGFTIAKNGFMYFSCYGIIYRTDGETNETVYIGANLGGSYKNASKNYCAFKDGIAFVKKNNDYTFSLIQIIDNTSKLLANTLKTEYFAEGFGLAPVSTGLMFSINDSAIDGIYVYNETTHSFGRIKISGEYIPSRRTIDFNDEINICWFGGKGYYSVNGIQGQEKLLIPSENSAAVQGDTMIYAKFEDKLVFIPLEGIWFDDDFLVYTDGTINGTSKIYNFENQYLSAIFTHDKYAFIVEGVSNNFTPKILQINLQTGKVDQIYQFSEHSTKINSVQLISIVDNYLYFLSKLDQNVGNELYRIKIEALSATTEKENPNEFDFSILQYADILTIQMDYLKEIEVQIFNSIGQNVYRNTVMSNEPFETGLTAGTYVINLKGESRSKSKLINIIR